MDEVDDEEGIPVRRPRQPPVPYDAIVEPDPSTGLDAAGSQFSQTGYTVVIISATDPLIRDRDPLVWDGKVMDADGDFVVSGPSAWRGRATEVSPNLDPPGVPFGS
jgi:hypothetical protein